MALRIAKGRTFTHPVTVRRPVDGGYSEETFKATFRVLPVSETAKYDFMTGKGTRSFLVAAVAKLDELEDETGQPLAYNDQVRNAVIDEPDTRAALVAAYFAGVRGAAEGN